MSGYGFYGLKPGERIKFTKKENGKKVSKVVKVVKEYPYFCQCRFYFVCFRRSKNVVF